MHITTIRSRGRDISGLRCSVAQVRRSARGSLGRMLRLPVLLFAALVAGAAAQTDRVQGERTRAPVLVDDRAPRRDLDSMAERVRACTSCHGEQGRAGPDGWYPRIAGKPAGYLLEQLRAFRERRREYAPMVRLLQPLSDEYLADIAAYFAALELPYPAPPSHRVPADALARGRQLAVSGDAARKVPACTQCHGEGLTGVRPGIPGLLGLPRDYLIEQLGAWRNGLRRARAPDCMAQVALALADDDVGMVASWLAAQPVPLDAAPIAAPTAQRPIECAKPAEPMASPPPVDSIGAQSTNRAERIERGRYLAKIGNCAGCHTASGGAPFAGGRAVETPFGIVYSTNLTSHRDAGIGQWSAEDFWAALHDGRGRDGRALNPAFPYPYFSGIDRSDADALFAYVQTVAADPTPNRAHALRGLAGSRAALLLWRTLFFAPWRYVADEARSAAWNRGAYLFNTLGHCNACHAPRGAFGAWTVRALGANDGGGAWMSSGRWYAPSLQRPDEAGVAHWSLEQITALLRNGISANALANGPMAEVVRDSTAHLDEQDAQALALYLQQLTPIEPRPARKSPASAPTVERGAKLYDEHCADCHGSTGQGIPGAYPPLAGNRTVTMLPPVNLLSTILQGGFAAATPGNRRPYGMPPFFHRLSDDDIAELASFLRRAWGHSAEPVGALEVGRLR